MAEKGGGMTDKPICLSLTFDPNTTRAALSLPLAAGPRRPEWQKAALALLIGGLIGGGSILILRLGLGLNDAFAYLVSATVGASLLYIYWRWVAARGMAQILDKLAALYAQEGPSQTSFAASGITVASPNASSTLGWPVFTAIDAIPGGTALLYGASRLVIPDQCLPAETDASVFRAQLEKWKSAYV
jgi:hypothetical protein